MYLGAQDKILILSSPSLGNCYGEDAPSIGGRGAGKEAGISAIALIVSLWNLNRTIAFGPDGLMYLTVGSTCNACPEPNGEHATILRADADGKNRKVYAKGLRNTIGFG